MRRGFQCVLVLSCYLIVGQTMPVSAAFGSGSKGTRGGQFLEVGVGARAIAMGEAYSAVVDEASAIYWNPAALLQIDNHSATFMHAIILDDTSYNFAAYGGKLDEFRAWGIGVQYLAGESIKETDSLGIETGGEFNPSDLAVSIGYAWKLHGIGFGLVGKYISSKLAKRTSALAMDIGVLSPRLLGDRLTVAFRTQNIGEKLKYDRQADSLPLSYGFGASMVLTEVWLGSLDVNLPQHDDPFVALGTEYRIPYGSRMQFAGRMGFNSRSVGDASGLTGITVGLGTIYKNVGIDYAFEPLGALGDSHRFSLTTRWGK